MSKARKPEIKIHSSGLCADHSEPCHVCLERSAVYQTQTGLLDPCWKCKGNGWVLWRLPRWLRWILSTRAEAWRQEGSK